MENFLDLKLNIDDIFSDGSNFKPLTHEEVEQVTRILQRDSRVERKFHSLIEELDRSVYQYENGYGMPFPHEILHQYVMRKLLGGFDLSQLPSDTDINLERETKKYFIDRTKKGYIISYEDRDKNNTKHLEIDSINNVYDFDKYIYVIDVEFEELIQEEINREEILQSTIDELTRRLAESQAQNFGNKNLADLQARANARNQRALNNANDAIDSLAESLDEQAKKVEEQIEENAKEVVEQIKEVFDDILPRVEANEDDIEELKSELDNKIKELEDAVEKKSKSSEELSSTLSRFSKDLADTLKQNAKTQSKAVKDITSELRKSSLTTRERVLGRTSKQDLTEKVRSGKDTSASTVLETAKTSKDFAIKNKVTEKDTIPKSDLDKIDKIISEANTLSKTLILNKDEKASIKTMIARLNFAISDATRKIKQFEIQIKGGNTSVRGKLNTYKAKLNQLSAVRIKLQNKQKGIVISTPVNTTNISRGGLSLSSTSTNGTRLIQISDEGNED